MVAYRLGTGEVPGSKPSKGENFSVKILNSGDTNRAYRIGPNTDPCMVPTLESNRADTSSPTHLYIERSVDMHHEEEM